MAKSDMVVGAAAGIALASSFFAIIDQGDSQIEIETEENNPIEVQLLSRSPFPIHTGIEWDDNPEPSVIHYTVLSSKDGKIWEKVADTILPSYRFQITETTYFSVTAYDGEITSPMSRPIKIEVQSSLNLKDWDVPDSQFYRIKYEN